MNVTNNHSLTEDNNSIIYKWLINYILENFENDLFAITSYILND